nr:EscR/YscR/HrcR family type III secretion system export apparatus protein [Methylibium sp.]
MTEYLPILIALGVLALLPFVALMVTSFAKIVIVLG